MGKPDYPCDNPLELRSSILELVRRYYLAAHQPKPFEPGKSRVPYSGRVYGAEEMVKLAEASLDFWLTLGPYGEKFEARMRGRPEHQHLGIDSRLRVEVSRRHTKVRFDLPVHRGVNAKRRI